MAGSGQSAGHRHPAVVAEFTYAAVGGVGPSNIIWRPGGVQSGNVVTSSSEVAAALNAANGAISIFIDSSIAPADVTDDWNGFGCASLFPFDTGQGFVFTIKDGFTLHDFANMQGLTAICECKTTQAFAFNPFSSFLLFNFATISLAAGAVVPAIRISAVDVTWTLFNRLGSVDNTNAPGVPVIETDAGALTTFYIHTSAVNFSFLTTGNEIGGGPGSTVFWENDDTVPPLASALFTGTLEANASSFAQFLVYQPAVPGDWVAPPPTTTAQALDRIAANHLNVHPIP